MSATTRPARPSTRGARAARDDAHDGADPGVCGFGRPDAVLLDRQARQGSDNGVHVAFTAPDRATVDAFHEAALAAGGNDNGEPGVREIYHPHYYGAFVLDPDGNNVEAVCHAPG